MKLVHQQITRSETHDRDGCAGELRDIFAGIMQQAKRFPMRKKWHIYMVTITLFTPIFN